MIWGSYDLVALNGATGALKWRSANPNRVWPGVAVADLTGNGSLEVIVGRGSNLVVAHNGSDGSLLWSRTAFPAQSGEVRTLAVADLERDGLLEVVVGRASGGQTKQLNVFDAAGNIRPGWPARRDGELGFGWGMYNENVAVGDLNGDGMLEVIGPTDTHYITALDRNGNQLGVNSMYSPRQVWSQQGVHVDHAADLQGYAECGIQHRPNFANTAPAIADVNADGINEFVVVGDVYDCAIGDPDGDLYHLPWILRMDRTRWAGNGFDWTVIPSALPASGPLTQDFNLIQNSVNNTVVADLDGDGLKEILYPSYDGRLHAYWLDKTQHGNWPYDVPGTGIRFASEPIVADLNGDGKAEVIFTSWPENGGNRIGQLHVLDYLGNSLHALNLPAGFGTTWNGGLAAPTLANIDADADLEIVIGTSGSGVVAYDLPGSANAHVLWGTGRGSNRRTGVASPTCTPAGSPDGDLDNIPNTIELQENTDPCIKDNHVFTNGRLFTMQQYRDFLGREGDAFGISYWSAAIAGGTSRATVTKSYFDSPEFQGAIAPVTRLYYAYFNRIPDKPGLDYWIYQYRSGTPLNTVSQAFASSAEFIGTYGNLNNSQFVTLVYQNVLGRAPDAAGLAYWTGQLNSASMTRGQVMVGFSESSEYQLTSYNRVFVTMVYYGMLRRMPDQAGFNYWVALLGGGSSALNLINGFLAAAEYRGRFLP